MIKWLVSWMRQVKYCFRRLLYLKRYGGNVHIGRLVWIHKTAIIDAKSSGGGAISIGDDTVINEFSDLISHGGSIEIGKNSYVGPFSVLYGHGGLRVGNNVKIAASCILIPSNHLFDRLDLPICQQGEESSGIIVEEDVWIGSRVTILDGVRVAKGCVIGAGAVVTRSTEAYGVYVGVPARKLRQRGDK